MRVRAMWAGALALLAACAGGAAQNASPVAPLDLLSALGGLRPAKAVLRAVRAAAPELFQELGERVRAWGYPFEAHSVRTEDGYLLTAHRIPGGRRGGGQSNALGDAASGTASARPPVILQHGMVACSDPWVIGGPDMAPALRMADAGYDVWMTNVRGNHYSNKHETLGRRDKRFWMFSWHEMGVYDIPAFIDYILNATRQENLFHVGHSMGNTIFFVAMSMRPEYNDKIRLHISLAPGVFFDNMTSTIGLATITNIHYIKRVVDALPTYELIHKTDSMIAMVYLLCGDKAYFNKLCAVTFSSIVGALDLNDTNHLSLLFSRTGSSSSVLVLEHYAQVILTGKFQQMDHGAAENMRAYGSPQAPDYPLSRVTAPVLLFAAEGDSVITVKATEHLAKMLPNVVSLKVINEKFFNHMDFIYHRLLNKLVTDPTLEIMSHF